MTLHRYILSKGKFRAINKLKLKSNKVEFKG